VEKLEPSATSTRGPSRVGSRRTCRSAHAQGVDQAGDHAQRQPLAGRAVAAGRERQPGELAQVGDRRVAVQDLDQEQPQRDQRRQQPLAPGVPAGPALLLDVPTDEKILRRQRLAPQPGQNVSDSHPWPPVGW
jgi:hypothetical protein